LLNNNIYSPKYNFFKLNESVPTTYTQLVRNTVRNDIFSELVTEEVFHVLNSVRTNSPWSELTVQRLTLDKIEVSLNPEFLRSLKSIRYLNGEPVEKSNFLEAIKRHLLTGTLNEVDVGYYDTLARAQARSEINTYVLPETYQQKQKVALSKLILESVPADSGKYSDLTKQIIRRQRRLNEDINTKCYACTLENETKSLMIPNAGICVTTTSNGNFNIENSPGDGYYLYLNTVDRGCIPYRYETDVSAALMAPPEVRYGALKIAGIDPDLHLIAESTSSNHEFVAGHTAEVTFEPIYFKLDLSSVSSTPTLNPVIDNITATFSVLQTQEEIDEHTDNNALTVTRVFVDYRDPIYRYAKESGKLSFSQNDINLRSLTERLGNELILTRNVPFGIILVPSRGSQFNPFNSTSKITSLEDTVTRDIALMPSINLVDTKYSSPFLNVNKLYDLEMDRVGIAEPVDVEGGTFRYVSSSPYFRNTLYDGSRYTSSIDSVSSYGTSYLVKDVLDYLITTYSPSEISWFDVFRRMPLNKFGELMYDISEDVLLKLAEGYRGNIKIKNILDRFDADSKVLNDDDKCIIKKYDRI
jgi:hypothetical protein